MSNRVEFTAEQRAEMEECGTPVVVKSMVRTVVGEFEAEGLPYDAARVVTAVRERLGKIKIGHAIGEEEQRGILIREFQQMFEQEGEANERDGMETIRNVTVVKTNRDGERYEAKMDIVTADLTTDSATEYDADAVLEGDASHCPHCGGKDVLAVNLSEFYCNACDRSWHAQSDVGLDDVLSEVLKRDVDLAKTVERKRAEQQAARPTVKRVVD